MNNLPQRAMLIVVGVLITLALIINHWLNKELVAPVEPTPVFIVEDEAPPAVLKVEQKDYDPHSDYAPVPSTEGLAQEVFAVEKKQERVIDEKIIYEMPTSNRFLLQ